KCELSSIDTSLLLCGVLTARQHFRDQEIKDLATKIYERVDWPWMLNGGHTFFMGWHPETGFLKARWEHYCELMMIYLLAIGSPTHPVSPDTWTAWSRPIIKFENLEYISGNDPIFTHQYSQAWYDFRKKRDAYTDYYENSIKATKAHKLFCLRLHDRFSDYSEQLWGITSSDSAVGYQAWGGPPALGKIDGSVVPCATGGSLVLHGTTLPSILPRDRKSTRLNSSHGSISYAVFCLKKKNQRQEPFFCSSHVLANIEATESDVAEDRRPKGLSRGYHIDSPSVPAGCRNIEVRH